MTHIDDQAVLRAAQHMIEYFGAEAAAEAAKRADRQLLAGNEEAHEHWAGVLLAVHSLQKHSPAGSH